MPNPSSQMTVASNSRPPKNPKAATVVEQDPELWRDIQANVRKMDDLYDATFYTWLRSEDNVLVTASYLQRLAGEYDLERIEHALCWLVHGWRLESIAVLVKEVTFDWALTKGCQGEKDRARLVLALTDNWSIQYVARLACTLLTGATSSSLPPLALQFTGHTRSVSCSGSPLSPISAGTTLTRTSPSDTRARATTPTSQPTSGHDQMADARRMMLSRRHIPPAPAMTPEDGAYSFGRPMAAAAGLIPSPTSVRDARATCPNQHNALRASAAGQATQPSTLATTAPIYPTSQQTIQHTQQCVNHTQQQVRYQQQQQQQQQQQLQQLQQMQQQQQQPPRFTPAAHTPHLQPPQHTRLHSRQQSQPDNTSASKLQWQQQSWANAAPTFYMDKDVFMEELSKKWSFCRLSEFFQCVDLASGISHRFKCGLLKESALKEEQTRAKKRQQLQLQAARSTTSTTKPLTFQPSVHPLSSDTTDPTKSAGATATTSTSQGGPLGAGGAGVSLTLGTRTAVNHERPSSSGDSTKASETVAQSHNQANATFNSAPIAPAQDMFSKDVPQSPADEPMEESGASSADVVSTAAFQNKSQPLGSTSSTPSSSPSPHTPLDGSIRYHPVQGYAHGNYSDDMNSILSRGWGSGEGGHHNSHSRSQTVDAIMSNPSLSPSSSAVSSPISTSSASASLSTLTLADTGRETSLPRQSSQQFLNHHHQEQHHQHHQHQQQQHQGLSSYGAASFGSQGLFRNGPNAATTSSTTSSTSVSDMGPLGSGGATTLSTSSSAVSLSSHNSLGHPHRQPNDSSSAKRKNSLGVGSLTSPNHCSGFGPSSTSPNALHAADGSSLSSSSAIFPGPRRTSTSASTSNEDLKRVRCSRQGSTTSTTSG